MYGRAGALPVGRPNCPIDNLVRCRHLVRHMSPNDPPETARDAIRAIAKLRKAHEGVSVTPVQVRAARVLLGWNDALQLAKAAGVAIGTVRRFETGDKGSDLAKLAMIEALEEAGIEFIERGVRLREPKADE